MQNSFPLRKLEQFHKAHTQRERDRVNLFMKQASGTGEIVEENLMKITELAAHFLCLQSGKIPLWSILLNITVVSKLFIKTWIFKKFSTSHMVLIPGFHPGSPGSIPGTGVVTFWASQVAQWVKNLPAMQETQV